MSIELRIGPPASGKTDSCIQSIKTTLSEHALAEIWTVVPDRLQATAFRRRLASAGGSLGAHVGTFGDLYQQILKRSGIYVPVASSALLHRLIQESVDRAAEQGELRHFSPIRTAPGFILVLREAFAELKRSLIYPDQFLAVTQSGTQAQKELALLYARYQLRLQELSWADSDGLSWLAVEALQNHPTAASSIRLLVVDGFDSFTSAQREALRLLANRVTDLLITFPGEKASNRIAHRRFTKVIDTLCQELSPRITSLGNSPHLPPDVLHIESHLFEPTSEVREAPAALLLLEARSPSDEAREALRWIKARLIRDHIPLTDCAIFAPNLDIYRPLLHLAAAEFGIPIRITQSEPLSESPAIAALENLLNLPVQNFKMRSMFNALRSTYFDFGIDNSTVDLLETVSRVARIVEGQDQWEETWKRLTLSKLDEYPDIDEQLSLPGLPRGTEAKSLQNALVGFFNRVTPPAKTLGHTVWVSWLENMLDDLQFYENASNDRDRLACESLSESLRALVFSELVVGPREVDYATFLSDLQGTLDGVALPEPRITGQPTLLVGSLAEARGIRYQAVALLGLSEGVFPEVERADPFLDEDLRRTLGLESRLQREQASLFYQAVTRTDQHLLITRPYLTEDGEDWEPSPFWKAVQSLFDDSTVQRIRPDDAQALTNAASSQELLFWAVRRQGLPKRYAELQPRWEALRQARDIVRARRAKEPASPYEGQATAITPDLTARYSPDQVWSASRLEAYGTCPQMFYVSVALDLEAIDTPALGLDPSQIGSMLHKILEQAYKTSTDPTDVEAVVAVLPIVAKQVFKTAPDRYGFRPSPLWEVEQNQFLDKLEETIRALAEEGLGWTPFAYEQRFGLQGKPPLMIDLGGEVLRIHGVIDRLDRNIRGEIRVIDYKTGSSHLAPSDLKDGRRLQLPIYAMAARDALGLGTPVDGIYWKILAGEAGSLKLAKFKNAEGEGLRSRNRHYQRALAPYCHRHSLGRVSTHSTKGRLPTILSGRAMVLAL